MVQHSEASTTHVRTGAWYGDHTLPLSFPDGWEVCALWPRTPSPLTDAEISAILESPTGQPSLKELARGKRQPIIIVDDLNRPTPASRVLPFVLQQLRAGGVSPDQVRILMAGGTHGKAHIDSMRKKVGPQAASSCKLLVHDPRRELVKIGRTSLGTPIFTNRELPSSDLIIGIGGIYPNHTAGFGGGSKLALGVLGIRSIMHLHYRHRAIGWAGEPDGTFRKDLDEIARAIGIQTMISLQIDANRELIRIDCGDYLAYHHTAVAFARSTFSTSITSSPDVVIANTYPIDLSLTFARMKGIIPLRRYGNRVTKIAIASCHEGVGEHGLFPLIPPRFHRPRQIARQLSILGPRQLALKSLRRLCGRLPTSHKQPTHSRPGSGSQHPILLYRPGEHSNSIPNVPGVRVTSSWTDVLNTIRKEQGDRPDLKIMVYPCAPLQA